VQQLKKLWTSLKEMVQQGALTSEKQARFATGGGAEVSSVEIDPDIAMTPNLMTTSPVLFTFDMSDDKIESNCFCIVNN